MATAKKDKAAKTRVAKLVKKGNTETRKGKAGKATGKPVKAGAVAKAARTGKATKADKAQRETYAKSNSKVLKARGKGKGGSGRSH